MLALLHPGRQDQQGFTVVALALLLTSVTFYIKHASQNGTAIRSSFPLHWTHCGALNLWLHQAVKLPSSDPVPQSLEIKRTMSFASMPPGKEEEGTFTCFKPGGGHPVHHKSHLSDQKTTALIRPLHFANSSRQFLSIIIFLVHFPLKENS